MARAMTVFSRISTASCRKNPPSSKWSTSRSNVSFIGSGSNFGIGQPVDAFFQHIVPDAFHLAVAFVEVILQLTGSKRGEQMRRIDYVRGEARMNDGVGRAIPSAAWRKRHDRNDHGDREK